MKIILYSNHCPQCIVLATKLKQNGIEYEEINDVDLMISKGFRSMPMLEVDDVLFKYADALQWVNNNNNNNLI